MLKKILMWTVIGFIAMQLIPVDRVNPPVKKSENFVDLLQPPAKVQKLLKNACYDCHSNETIYPKYAYVAPISWSVKHHVNEGREHLNFSVWGKYNKDLKDGMLEKSVNEIKDEMMPMPAYIIYHDNAKLTKEERALLEDYFQTLLDSEKY